MPTGWVLTWTLAAALWLACKMALLVSDRDAVRRRPARAIAWLVAWPGMDLRGALSDATAPPPRARAWIAAWLLAVAGATLLLVAAPALLGTSPTLAVALGAAGIVMLLHFGLFRVAQLAWQLSGIGLTPIMDAPLRATSLAEFWGRRWNLAFHELASRFVKRPVARRAGEAAGIGAAFLASGLVHELVLTLPARGGYGGPTLYFAIQCAALFAQRLPIARRLGLNRGLTGRALTLLVALLPLPLLLPAAVRANVLLPMIADLAPFVGADGAARAATLARVALIFAAIAHGCVLVAGVQVPWRLDWRNELARLSRFNRKIPWVYHGFIGLIIVAFGAMTALLRDEMLRGDRAALALVALMAAFWIARLLVDAFFYEDDDWPPGRSFAVGHALLVLAFVGMASTYAGLLAWHLLAPGP